MNALLPFFWTVGWALLSQVLLFRYGVFWGGYGLLVVHVYGLLKQTVGLGYLKIPGGKLHFCTMKNISIIFSAFQCPHL